MATINPFTDDQEGGLWEQGYLAGFNDPDNDHLPGPFNEDLALICIRG